MTHIGLLLESDVRRNIAKIIKLMKIKRELKNRIPVNPMEKACLPIQRIAVNEEIRVTVRYLRNWRVDIKACMNEN